ncbi:MAG: hypothetical protein WBC49_01625 [Thermoplasmata archaeon]
MVQIKITPQMSSRWVKAVFLILLGFVVLLYHDGMIDDLERNAAEEFNMDFEWTWILLRVLIWVLIAWLFVDAVMIILLSLKTETYTLSDVVVRLNAIEKRLSSQGTRTPIKAPVVEEMVPGIPAVDPEEEPPPPFE